MPMFALAVRSFAALLGLAFISLGIALITKAGLGCTPIAAMPLVLALTLPILSYGGWIISLNLLFVGFEWLLLRWQISRRSYASQILLTFIFGFCVDLCMLALQGYAPEAYHLRLITVGLGSLSMAVGIFLSVKANVALLPVDAFVLSVNMVSGLEFGRARLYVDVCMALGGLLLGWIGLEALASVREGTLLAALLTGPLVRLISRFGRKR